MKEITIECGNLFIEEICNAIKCTDCPVIGGDKDIPCVDALDAYIKANGLTIHIQPEKE